VNATKGGSSRRWRAHYARRKNEEGKLMSVDQGKKWNLELFEAGIMSL